jgi:hypothetical protein
LTNVNVTAGDSRDEEKRWRFFPFTVESFVGPHEMGKDFWFWDYIKYPYFHVSDERNFYIQLYLTEHLPERLV